MRSHVALYVLLAAVLASALAAGCGTDAEGPVTVPFHESGWYSPDAGETVRHIEPMSSVSALEIPMGIGTSLTLKLGESKGVHYKNVLIQFGYDSLVNYTGMTVDSVVLDLPVVTVQDTLFHLGVTFNELLEAFDEYDTITAPPAYDPFPIEGAGGETVRDISFERTEFSIDRTIVQEWLDGTSDPWQHGISINWAAVPDTFGLIEMKAKDYGSDPPVLKVILEGGDVVLLPSVADYSITEDNITGIAAAGGVARRIYFQFDLEGVPENAFVNYSALVFHTEGSRGLGASYGEILLGATTDFPYYIYAPDSTDFGGEGLLGGTGVSRNQLPPEIDAKIKIPLGKYMIDILSGARVNTGLVIQSDLEASRVQILALYDESAGDSLRPYIELVYTMPTDFEGRSPDGEAGDAK
jgi:hypothetical protein